jgi:hypothetical protein
MDKLFAQYRILDAMGVLVSSVVDETEYNKLIKPTLKPFDIVKDELPINLDEYKSCGCDLQPERIAEAKHHVSACEYSRFFHRGRK